MKLKNIMKSSSSVRMSTTKGRTPFWRNISAEPAVFVYSFGMHLYQAGTTNLIQQKVCSPETPPPTDFVCHDSALLAEAIDIVTVQSTVKNFLPMIILLFAGSWRDSTNLNKPLIYFSLFTEIVGIGILTYANLNWTSSAWITTITEAIVVGLGGNKQLFILGASSVITANAQAEDRTTVVTLTYTGLSLGSSLAFAVSGYILTSMGRIWFLIFTLGLMIATCVLIKIFVKDKETKERKGDVCKMLKLLKSAFKRRPNSLIIWLMILSSSLIIIAISAERNIYHYYLQQTFGFSINGSGLYVAYRSIVGSVGSIIISPIFIKWLKWSDFKIAIFCSLIAVISSISMVFATTTVQIKIFGLLDITKIYLVGLPLSILSKCVKEDEIGVFTSFYLIIESILPIAINYVYDYLFTSTSKTLPGAFFLASCVICTIILIFYSISAHTYTPLEAFDEETKKVSNDLQKCQEVSNVPGTSNPSFEID